MSLQPDFGAGQGEFDGELSHQFDTDDPLCVAHRERQREKIGQHAGGDSEKLPEKLSGTLCTGVSNSPKPG